MSTPDIEQPRAQADRNYFQLYKKHFPLVNAALIAIYVVIFSTSPNWISEPDPSEAHILLDTAAPRREIWRLYTYSLLHGDWGHLINNSVFLALLGFLLNTAHGNDKYLLVHTLGVVGGGMAVFWESIAENGSRLLVVGASGGVYGIIGAHVGNIVINFSEMPDRWIRILFFSYYLLADLGMYIFKYNALVSYSGHLGGFLCGLAAGPIVLKNVREIPWERRLKVASAVALAVAGAASCLAYALA